MPIDLWRDACYITLNTTYRLHLALLKDTQVRYYIALSATCEMHLALFTYTGVIRQKYTYEDV